MVAIPAGEANGLVAGVELGGTKCICILGRAPDDVVASEQFPTMSPEESLKDLSRCLSEWRNAYEVAALGIASFGPLELDPNSPNFGSITSTPKPGWSGIDLKPLGAGLPSLIDTDVNGAALAEGRWGAARDLRSWCYITLGTGVGIASIVEGRPVTGAGHSEAGHMRVPLPAGSFEGVCPFHANCVEGVISGPAIAAWAGRSADTIADNDPIWEGVASILAQVCHNLALTTLPQRTARDRADRHL